MATRTHPARRGSGQAASEDGDPRAAADFGWALGMIFRRYVGTVDAAIEGVPGGPRGYEALSTVVHLPTRNQLALAARLGIDRTVLTYLLDALAEAGLVERRPDPADRRARRIVATAAGRTLLRRLERRVHTAEEDVLAGLDSADRAAFRTLLRRCAEHAWSLDPAASTCDAVADLRAADAGRHPVAGAAAGRPARRAEPHRAGR